VSVLNPFVLETHRIGEEDIAAAKELFSLCDSVFVNFHVKRSFLNSCLLISKNFSPPDICLVRVTGDLNKDIKGLDSSGHYINISEGYQKALLYLKNFLQEV